MYTVQHKTRKASDAETWPNHQRRRQSTIGNAGRTWTSTHKTQTY